VSDSAADNGIYIDGLEIGPWDDLWLRSTPTLQVSLLSIGLFHHDAEHAPVGIRVDNVVISTERIGCPSP